MNLKVVAVLTATMALAGCASTQNAERAALQEHDNLQLGYIIHDGYPNQNDQRGSTRDGYFVVFDVSAENAPKITGIYPMRPVVEDWQDKEILFVSGDLSEVQPDWRTWYPYEVSGRFICWKGSFNFDYDKELNDYNPCNSTLTKSSARVDNIVNTVANAVFSLGVGALTGSGQYSVVIDKPKVAALIENTQMMTALRETQRRIAEQEARAERMRADLAEIDRQEEERQQQIRERQRQIEAEAMERRRQQAVIERQQREVEYTRWRRTLAVGSSTFCGFVIERNGPMVKIAVNTLLPGYPSEQWLKIDEVYPAHLGLSTAADP